MLAFEFFSGNSANICKRSLGQGNVFTPVCHSVHKWVCASQHLLEQGVSVRGVSAWGVSAWGVSAWGVCLPVRCVCPRCVCPHPHKDSHGSWQHTSYWNAFSCTHEMLASNYCSNRTNIKI